MSQQPYVSRPEAEDFLAALDAALKSPKDSPTVFNAWGIGGVGKSTLTRKVKEIYETTAKIAEVSFGLTEGIDEPIPLMAKLYEQIAVKDSWSRDPFWERYELYFETVHQLSTQATVGWGAATPEQVTQVKQLLKFGVDTFGELTLPEAGKKAANTLVDKGMDAAVAGLSLKDSLQQLLQQHKATKRNQALQRLMLEPLPQLTQAFAQGLSQQAAKQPIILVLDTYEKVPGVIDAWLWRTLLGNTDLSAHPVRLMVAGRHSLLKTEGWRKLHQDRDVVSDLTVERFTPEQTPAYLTQIGIIDDAQVENIGRVTRGLPYYLNWIREQSEKGRTLDFDQGNQEIVRLLLQGLNDMQKRVVQLAACCRWFDSKIIRYLTEQQGLDFATAVDEGQNCYGWLTQLSFAEPIGKRWRLDDVARDVFRQSLDGDERETIHQALTDHFWTLSEREVALDQPPPDQYKNPHWRTLRAEYLYHLLFTRQETVQPKYVSHLLEGAYLNEYSVTRQPLAWIMAELLISETELLPYQTQYFLQALKPAIEHPFLVFNWQSLFNEVPDVAEATRSFEQLIEAIDNPQSVPLENRASVNSTIATVTEMYRLMGFPIADNRQLKAVLQQILPIIQSNPQIPQLRNLANQKMQQVFERLGYSLAEVEAATALCFRQQTALQGLGKCVALIYESKVSPARKADLMLSAFAEAQKVVSKSAPHFSCNLLEGEIGNALCKLGRYEEAISSYDAALAIKPDYPAALYNKGFVLGNLGRYEEAISSYDAALAIKPDYHDALAARGKTFLFLGAIEQAKEDFQRAGALQPDDPVISMMSTLASLMGNSEEPVDPTKFATFIQQSLSSPELLEQLQANLIKINQSISWEQKVQEAEAITKALGFRYNGNASNISAIS
jgi:tetratricopeptide (TPR) repeat protein